MRTIKRVGSMVILGAVAALTMSSPASARSDARDNLVPVSAQGATPQSYGPIHNLNSAKCLGISASSLANGGKAIQWTCLAGEDDQQWQLEQFGSTSDWKIRNLNSGKCLAIPAGSLANGTQAVQWTCSPSEDDQRWQLFYDTEKDALVFRNYNSGKCLGISASSMANGGKAIQWICLSDENDQRWY
jgi:hypothetical protein